jgi:predicted nucleic acid-binding protein
VRALLDTSVLVAALVESHGRHAQTFPWLQGVRRGEVHGVIAAHSVAETYAVLSTLPVSPRVSPSAAWALIEHSILPFVEAVDLSASEAQEVVRHVSRQGLIGGVVYDALISAAAAKARVECIVTLNPGDFRRVAQAGAPDVREP